MLLYIPFRSLTSSVEYCKQDQSQHVKHGYNHVLSQVLRPKLVYIIASLIEKTIVLNMLRMAAMGEIDPYPQQQQPTDTYKSNFHANKPRHSQSRETDAKEPLNEAKDLLEENTPFKLPKHDTIIQSAQSRTAEISRQSQRSFHERLQMELDQSETLTRNRQRSRSLTTPPDKRSRPSSGRCTARPCSAGGVYRTICNDSLYPPPPVRVTVSREKLQGKPLTQQSYRR